MQRREAASDDESEHSDLEEFEDAEEDDIDSLIDEDELADAASTDQEATAQEAQPDITAEERQEQQQEEGEDEQQPSASGNMPDQETEVQEQTEQSTEEQQLESEAPSQVSRPQRRKLEPYEVPMDGAFWLHDDRIDVSTDPAQQQTDKDADDDANFNSHSSKSRGPRVSEARQKLWDPSTEDKWSHDKYEAWERGEDVVDDEDTRAAFGRFSLGGRRGGRRGRGRRGRGSRSGGRTAASNTSYQDQQQPSNSGYYDDDDDAPPPGFEGNNISSATLSNNNNSRRGRGRRGGSLSSSHSPLYATSSSKGPGVGARVTTNTAYNVVLVPRRGRGVRGGRARGDVGLNAGAEQYNPVIEEGGRNSAGYGYDNRNQSGYNEYEYQDQHPAVYAAHLSAQQSADALQQIALGGAPALVPPQPVKRPLTISAPQGGAYSVGRQHQQAAGGRRYSQTASGQHQ